MIFELIDETLGDLDFERGTLDNVISPYEVNNLYWNWKKKNLNLDGAESYLIELIGRNHMDLYEYLKEEYNVSDTGKIDCIGKYF